MQITEARLATHDWLAFDRPGIANINSFFEHGEHAIEKTADTTVSA